MRVRRLLPILILTTGCGFLSRSQSRIYELDRLPPAAAPAPVTGLPVAIDGIELPPGVDRKEVVVRRADHQLDVRSAEQWSASLQPLVLHTLASDLAARLPDGMMILPGAVKPTGAVRSIDVVFEELAAGPDSTLVLDARWNVREPGRGTSAHHERITVTLASLDSANVSTGLSQAIAQLADRMAAELTR